MENEFTIDKNYISEYINIRIENYIIRNKKKIIELIADNLKYDYGIYASKLGLGTYYIYIKFYKRTFHYKIYIKKPDVFNKQLLIANNFYYKYIKKYLKDLLEIMDAFDIDQSLVTPYSQEIINN